MSRKQSDSLQYAIRDGRLLHISDVPSGLACACVCPACNARLVARKGRHREHHFAHFSGDPCEYAKETSLHLAAKDILLMRKEIVLPPVEMRLNSNVGYRLIKPETRYKIDQINLEHRLSTIVPDIFVEIAGHRLIVEIKVTHGIDDEKRQRIRDLAISAVEIDLSDAPRDLPPADLEQLVIEGGSHKRWVHSELAKRWWEKKSARATWREVSSGTTWGCPLSPKQRGEPYQREASFLKHCIYCEQALDAQSDGGVLCLA